MTGGMIRANEQRSETKGKTSSHIFFTKGEKRRENIQEREREKEGKERERIHEKMEPPKKERMRERRKEREWEEQKSEVDNQS